MMFNLPQLCCTAAEFSSKRAGRCAGQGFAQAAEDAHRLATALQEHGVTPEALRAYEHTRRERVIRIQAAERVRY